MEGQVVWPGVLLRRACVGRRPRTGCPGRATRCLSGSPLLLPPAPCPGWKRVAVRSIQTGHFRVSSLLTVSNPAHRANRKVWDPCSLDPRRSLLGEKAAHSPLSALGPAGSTAGRGWVFLVAGAGGALCIQIKKQRTGVTAQEPSVSPLPGRYQLFKGWHYTPLHGGHTTLGPVGE